MKNAVIFALNHGEATVPGNVARPNIAEERARAWLRSWGHERALRYETTTAGELKMTRTEYVKPGGIDIPAPQ